MSNSEIGDDGDAPLRRSFESSGFGNACSEPAGVPPPQPGASRAGAPPLPPPQPDAPAYNHMLDFPGPQPLGWPHAPGFPPPPTVPSPLVTPPTFLSFHAPLAAFPPAFPAPAAFPPPAFPPPNFPWSSSGANQQQQQAPSPPPQSLELPPSSPSSSYSSSPRAQVAPAGAVAARPAGGGGANDGSGRGGETGFTGTGTVWVERERATEVFDAVFDPVAFSHAVGLRSLSSSTTGSDHDLHASGSAPQQSHHPQSQHAASPPCLAPSSQRAMGMRDSDESDGSEGSSKSNTSSPGPPHSGAQGAMQAGAAADATLYDREPALWMHAPPPLELLGLPPKLVSALSGSGSGGHEKGCVVALVEGCV